MLGLEAAEVIGKFGAPVLGDGAAGGGLMNSDWESGGIPACVVIGD